MRVRFTTTARRHAVAIGRWWREHRADAPEMFAEELGMALQLLKRTPHVGSRYAGEITLDVRRLLLRRSSHHLYYSVIDREIVVRAIWHTARGNGPDLGR